MKRGKTCRLGRGSNRQKALRAAQQGCCASARKYIRKAIERSHGKSRARAVSLRNRIETLCPVMR